MITKYSALNFTAKKVAELRPGERILETEKKKKLRTVAKVDLLLDTYAIPDSDKGKILICFEDCTQLVKEPEAIVFVYNEPEPLEMVRDILPANISSPVVVTGSFLERNIKYIDYLIIGVPLILLVRWLFKSERNDLQ